MWKPLSMWPHNKAIFGLKWEVFPNWKYSCIVSEYPVGVYDLSFSKLLSWMKCSGLMFLYLVGVFFGLCTLQLGSTDFLNIFKWCATVSSVTSRSLSTEQWLKHKIIFFRHLKPSCLKKNETLKLSWRKFTSLLLCRAITLSWAFHF